MATGKICVGVLVSGKGTNLQAIINACKAPEFPAKVVLVISSVTGAYAIKRAKLVGIQNITVDHHKFGSTAAFEGEIIRQLRRAKVDLVCLAGFMRVLSPKMLQEFPHKIMNIHPALLPAFPGLHAQRAALEHGVKVSGVTIHFVDEGTDTGPIILQHPVPVHDADTEEILSKRILRWEHTLYPQAIKLFAEKRLTIQSRKVLIREGE